MLVRVGGRVEVVRQRRFPETSDVPWPSAVVRPFGDALRRDPPWLLLPIRRGDDERLREQATLERCAAEVG